LTVEQGFLLWLNYFSRWVKICVFFFPSSQTFKKLRNILQNRQNSLLGSSKWPKNVKDTSTFLFSYLVDKQIWLNCLMDDRHFGYNTKMKIKPCFGGRVWLPSKSDWGEGRARGRGGWRGVGLLFPHSCFLERGDGRETV